MRLIFVIISHATLGPGNCMQSEHISLESQSILILIRFDNAIFNAENLILLKIMEICKNM